MRATRFELPSGLRIDKANVVEHWTDPVQTSVSNNTTIQFQSNFETFSSHGAYNPSTGFFTYPYQGRYLIVANLLIQANTDMGLGVNATLNWDGTEFAYFSGNNGSDSEGFTLSGWYVAKTNPGNPTADLKFGTNAGTSLPVESGNLTIISLDHAV
jgi:hypothetical protein